MTVVVGPSKFTVWDDSKMPWMVLMLSDRVRTCVSERMVSIEVGKASVVYYLKGVGRVLGTQIQQSFFR